MAEGFRKAFLGFNCNDVIEYVKKTHTEFSEKEEELNLKIKNLQKEIEEKNNTINEKDEKIKETEKALEVYRQKEEEINRISENIGKLYIVSQANAKAITETAEENRRLAEEEITKNLDALKSAHEKLTSIIKGVTDTSVDFTDNMKSLSGELDNTINAIVENNEKCGEKVAEKEKILSNAE